MMHETPFCLARIPDSSFSLLIERLTDERDFSRLALDVIMTHNLAGPGQKGFFRLPGEVQPLRELPAALSGVRPDFADEQFRNWIVSGPLPSPDRPHLTTGAQDTRQR